MNRIAVFPGSFDPITNGHVDIINRALKVFDKVIIGLGNNSAKNYLFPAEQRKAWIEDVFAKNQKVETKIYEGLTVRFCKENGAEFIIRGLRSAPDFEFEKNIAQFNKAMEGIDSVLFITEPSLSPISSTVVRDLIKNKGDIRQFVPKEVDITKLQ